METLVMPAINFAAIMPETILSVFAMVLLLLNVFIPGEQKAYLGCLEVTQDLTRERKLEGERRLLQYE